MVAYGNTTQKLSMVEMIEKWSRPQWNDKTFLLLEAEVQTDRLRVAMGETWWDTFCVGLCYKIIRWQYVLLNSIPSILGEV